MLLTVFRNEFRRLESVHDWHSQIHQDDSEWILQAKALYDLQGLLPVHRFFKVILLFQLESHFHQIRQNLYVELLIVNDEQLRLFLILMTFENHLRLWSKRFILNVNLLWWISPLALLLTQIYVIIFWVFLMWVFLRVWTNAIYVFQFVRMAINVVGTIFSQKIRLLVWLRHGRVNLVTQSWLKTAWLASCRHPGLSELLTFYAQKMFTIR